MTSEPLQQTFWSETELPLMSSRAASRARHTVPRLEAVKPQKIYGQKWQEWRIASGPIIIAENVERAPIAISADFFCAMGMQCDVTCISANDVGAPHEQKSLVGCCTPTRTANFLAPSMQKWPSYRLYSKAFGARRNYRAAVCLSDGVPSGLGDVKAYGNAVVPQILNLLAAPYWRPQNDSHVPPG